MLPTQNGLSRRSLLRSTAAVGLSAIGLPQIGGAQAAGGTLRWGTSDVKAAERLDPLVASNGGIQLLAPLVFETLIRRGKNFSLHPCLAERWEHSDNATKWTFHLRKGVKFHDGSPFTAKDVAYTLRRNLDPKAGSALRKRLEASFDESGIEIVDDHTLAIRMKRSDTLLPHALPRTYGMIIKEGTVPTTDPKTAIGTGPFKVNSFQPGQSWEAVRFPQYWEPGRAHVDSIQCVAIPDQTAKVQALLSGAVDLVDPVDPVVAQQLSSNSAVRIARMPANRMWGIFLSQEVKPFDDIRVRQAIKLAVDRDLLLKTAYKGQGVTTYDVPVPPSDPYFPPELQKPSNAEAARKLLAEAGYPNGIEFELFTSPSRVGMVDLAVTFAEAVKPAGISVKVNQWPAATYWDQIWRKRPAYIDYISRRHVHDMIDVVFAKDGAFNGFKFDADGSLRALIDRAIGEVDEAKQKEMYQQALLKIHREASGAVPLFEDQTLVLSAKIQGDPFEFEDPPSYYNMAKRA